MELQKLVMIPCPRCGRPFPLKRKELGYNYCVNCSTEKHVSCIIEGTQDGDGDDTVHSTIHIVSWEEANAINRAINGSRFEKSDDTYDAPDMRTTEDLDESSEFEPAEEQVENEEEIEE